MLLERTYTKVFVLVSTEGNSGHFMQEWVGEA